MLLLSCFQHEDTQLVQQQDSHEMHFRLRKLCDVTSYAVGTYGSVSDIRLSGAQFHADGMVQRSFPHHSVHIKLISSNDICPIGSISYSCPPEERWRRRGRVRLKLPSMKLILILIQSVQMKLVCDTKCYEQIMAVQCVNIIPATVGSTLSFNSELKEIT
jgi:hypothetical protein